MRDKRIADLALCRLIRIRLGELKRENGQDGGWFLARSVSDTNKGHIRARGMILQHLDCDGLKSLGCFISHFGPADPRQALIGKWIGNTHSQNCTLSGRKTSIRFVTVLAGRAAR
jgi:hypothetical protein